MTTRKAPWEKGRPRRELAFPAVQTPTDLDFVPKKSRDPEEIATFLERRRKGAVIARNQRIGVKVMFNTFVQGRKELNAEDLDKLTDFISMLGFGTAYHLFVQHDSDDVDRRHIKLPTMKDDETGSRLYRADLLDQTAILLKQANEDARLIEFFSRVRASQPVRSQRLGRTLASVGVTGAAVAARVSQERGNEEKMQWHAWKAAQGAMVRMFELSGRVGERPTAAALADPHSELSRYLHDDTEFMSPDVYELLQTQVTETRKLHVPTRMAEVAIQLAD